MCWFKLIVDCWAGSDGESATVGPETLYPSFSVGKGVAASCAALCVDRGQLDYDEHLTERLWPGFAQRDPRITVAQALSYRAGVRASGSGDESLLAENPGPEERGVSA